MRHLGYIQLALVVLLMVLGWQIVDELVSKEKPISSLDIALQSAGKNRNELEKVLHHYQKDPADSLKYKAACFLIENMPFYTYLEGDQLENYKSYYVWLILSKGKTPEQVADSVKNVYGTMKEPSKKRDIVEVDFAYLCNNIEWAFKVWQEQPWGKTFPLKHFVSIYCLIA